MGQFAKLKWTAVAIFVAIAAFVLTNLQLASNGLDAEGKPRLIEVAPDYEDHDGGLATHDLPTEPTASSGGESTPCLTLEQLETHPVVAEDAYRWDAVTDSGPVIAAYRGLSEQELLDLAAQEDSAAMAVLGAMSIMKARELPVEKAVPYLLFEDKELMALTYKRPFPPGFIGHMKQARQWFYKAALHGRVLALYRVGDSLVFEHGGPVELGWISKEEYDGLSSLEKTALHPANLYNALAFEIAPALKRGPTGEVLSAMLPRTERQGDIVDQLADQFDRDLQDAGLPPVAVPESGAPSFDDLLLLLCDSEREWLEALREDAR